MDEKVILKKTMTKKEYKKRMCARRSMVGLDMKLGTITHKNPKDYNRRTEKGYIRKEFQKYGEVC